MLQRFYRAHNDVAYTAQRRIKQETGSHVIHVDLHHGGNDCRQHYFVFSLLATLTWEQRAIFLFATVALAGGLCSRIRTMRSLNKPN